MIVLNNNYNKDGGEIVKEKANKIMEAEQLKNIVCIGVW